MKVQTYISNIAAAHLAVHDVLRPEAMMELGRFVAHGSRQKMAFQVSMAGEGSSGTAVPNFSIEVDHVGAALEAIRIASAVEYGPADEPWGGRRFHAPDPFCKLLYTPALVGSTP